MHDAWQHLQVAGYQELCRPDVSRGALCSVLGHLKGRRPNLRWAMSIKSDDANFLTITCVRICLKTNQQSSRQRRTVPWCRTQLRRQILKQRWDDWFLLYCHLSDTLLRLGTAWNRTSSYHLDNEGMYLCRGPSYGDKFQGVGEGINSYRRESCHLWRTFKSRNRLKIARRSFPQQHSISWPLGKRP